MPASAEPPALAWYERSRPLVEQLVTLARDWRDADPLDEQAIQFYGECLALAIRLDLRRARLRGASPVDVCDA